MQLFRKVILLVVLSGIIGLTFLASSLPVLAKTSYVSRIPDGFVKDCTLCHSNPPRLNEFGRSFKAAGKSFDTLKPKPQKTIVLQIDSKNMSVNGSSQEIDPGRGTSPIIVKDRTLIPIRALIEALGGTVTWNEQESKVVLNLNNNVIQLWINKPTALVNDTSTTMDVAPQITNSRTMIPLRFVSENLGCQVAWDATTQKITITK